MKIPNNVIDALKACKREGLNLYDKRAIVQWLGVEKVDVTIIAWLNRASVEQYNDALLAAGIGELPEMPEPQEQPDNMWLAGIGIALRPGRLLLGEWNRRENLVTLWQQDIKPAHYLNAVRTFHMSHSVHKLHEWIQLNHEDTPIALMAALPWLPDPNKPENALLAISTDRAIALLREYEK